MQSVDCVPCSLQTAYLAPCSLQTAQVLKLHATYIYNIYVNYGSISNHQVVFYGTVIYYLLWS